MKIASSEQSLKSNYSSKPGFGCKYCDVMLEELKKNEVPKKNSIYWLDTCLIDIMSHNAKSSQRLYEENAPFVSDEIANHQKAAA